jgi:hypothetical protein
MLNYWYEQNAILQISAVTEQIGSILAGQPMFIMISVKVTDNYLSSALKVCSFTAIAM